MNQVPLIFLGVFLTMAASWWSLVVYPQIQLGRQALVELKSTGEMYPPARPGLAAQGREVYRSLGCAECHTQQVRQDGVEIGLAVTQAGTNLAELVEAVLKVDPRIGRGRAAQLVQELPQPVLADVPINDVEKARRVIEATGAKTMMTIKPIGADIARGWGARRSVAQDILREQPLMLGTRRVGPDLANYGARQTNAPLTMLHLYDPQLVALKSLMPPYRHLFAERVRSSDAPMGDALAVVVKDRPQMEVVPTDAARALVAYLMSLRSDEELFEAPLPKLATNPPAAGTNVLAATGNNATSVPK